MQKQKDTLDTLVRDLTTVHPMPKSEVRRRISDLVERAKAEERVRMREWVRTNLFTEGISPEDSRHCERIASLESVPLMQMHKALDYCNGKRNKLAQDLINFLSTPQEPRHGGGRG